MSFLKRLNAPKEKSNISLNDAVFEESANGLPTLRFKNGILIYGLHNIKRFEGRYKKEAPAGQSLSEFSLRTDFLMRYHKLKPTHKHLIERGNIVVEVGAYLGYHAMRIADEVGNTGRVVAIEMMPDIEKILSLNLLNNFGDRCISICSAVSPNEGTKLAYVGGGQANGLRRDVIERGSRVANQINVEGQTLDVLLSKLGLEQIDLVTLQLNGTEPDVLRALPQKFFDKVDAFSVAANYNSGSFKISHEISSILQKYDYETEIYENWVYAKRGTAKSSTGDEPKGPIFIGGCGRSGTTLLRLMLDAHPEICCGPETNVINALERLSMLDILSVRYGIPLTEVYRIAENAWFRPKFISDFFSMVATRHGKSRWAEKTPKNIVNLEYIFDNFQNAKFIHVVRDGRDVINSLRTHPKFKRVDDQIVPTHVNRSILECSQRWVDDVSSGLEWEHDPRVLMVKYEDLVLCPKQTMATVLKFVGEEWSDDVLRHNEFENKLRDPLNYPNNISANDKISTNRIGAWKDELSMEDLKVINKEAGALLSRLGYI